MGIAEQLSSIRRVLARQGDTSSDLDLTEPKPFPLEQRLTAASVLVPIVNRNGLLHVILTRRSPDLKLHAGQIALPGGRVEEGDEGVEETALRESQEEIGLAPSNVEVLGRCSCHVTVTGFLITPIVGLIKKPFTPKPQADEVEEVFEIPFDFLMDTRNYREESRVWKGEFRKFHAVPYDGRFIWGATARILLELARRLDPK